MKILVLQLKRIGDLILTSPALVALRENLKDAHLTLAVEQGCRELLPAFDYIDSTLIYNRSGENGALWSKMVFAHYDVCLDFTGNDRSALLSVLSKSRQRVAFQWIQKSLLRPLFYNRFVSSPVRDSHTEDHYMHLLRGVGLEPRASGARVPLRLPEWAAKKARQALESQKINSPYFIVHPGSARPEKYWVAKRWARVIDTCVRETGLSCIITGGHDPAEQDHIEKIKGALQVPCHDLTGTLDLLTLATLIRNAKLFLSVDSAAMHLAASFGTPQIALFGPTNPFHWRPRHPEAVVLAPGRIEPMTEFNPKYEAGRMADIAISQVTNALAAFAPPRQVPVPAIPTRNF